MKNFGTAFVQTGLDHSQLSDNCVNFSGFTVSQSGVSLNPEEGEAAVQL